MGDIRLFHGYMAAVPKVDEAEFKALEASFDEPFVGITTDGTPRSDLYSPEDPAAATDAIVDAALDFIDSLRFADQRRRPRWSRSRAPTAAAGPTPSRPGSPRASCSTTSTSASATRRWRCSKRR